MNWDDARIFLAVLRHRSLSAAAQALGCSHSTVRRRLSALESSVGAPLFVASTQGLTPTDAARHARPSAEALEQAALSFERRLGGHSEAITGRLRVTTIDAFGEWLADGVRLFCERHPGVTLELITDNRYLNIARGEADVAIRATDSPNEAYFGRRIGRFDFAPFASPALVARHAGPPETLPWVLFLREARAERTERWYAEWASGKEPMVRVSSATTQLQLVRSGVAGALLPASFVRREGLVQLGPVVDGLSVDLWCLTHGDLRESARVRAFMRAVADTVSPTSGPPDSAGKPASPPSDPDGAEESS